MNTKINYLYRDASNYKQWNEAVVKGTFTEEEKEEISACTDGLLFLPQQVGLHFTQFDEVTEDDHPWAELDEFEEVDEEPTMEENGKVLTAAELLANFRKAKKEGWQEVYYTELLNLDKEKED